MRRKEDKTKARLMIGLAILTALSSILASVIGYKAIRALDAFNAFMDEAREFSAARKHLPEGY